jgi:hypothetical protein
MATSNAAKTMLRIRQIIMDATGMPSTRVRVGMASMGDNKEFLALMVDQGPFIVIEPARQTGTEYHQNIKNFEIKLNLYYGYNADAGDDFDYTAIIDLHSDITAAVLNFPKYWEGECIPGYPISWEFVEELQDQSPHVNKSSCVLSFSGTAR